MQKLGFLLTFMILTMMSCLAVSPSGSLPVMYISTEDGAPIESRDEYLKGTYYLDAMGCEGVESFGSAEKPLPLQIRGRGNYTWVGYDKKPYRLKLDKKAALFGEAKSKHWALLAHADDKMGFLKNAMGFEMSRLVGLEWTPCHHPVEVVLNGDYIGLYFLTETTRVDKDRVNVWDYDTSYEDYADANDGAALPWQDEYATGGWLCEIDNYEDPNQVQINTADPFVAYRGGILKITYDTPSDYITEAHREWLRNEFLELDRLIVKGDRQKCEWADKIDLTNLARFFVVNQVLFNPEAFAGSCKLHREKGYDSKWIWGPVWDFGCAFESDDVCQFIFEYDTHPSYWIEVMYGYPMFVEEVKRVYAELKKNGFDSLYPFIDSYIESIRKAAAADYARWKSKGYGNPDLDACAAHAKYCLERSAGWLDSKWLDIPFVDVDPIAPPCDIYFRGQMTSWEAHSPYKFEKIDGSTYRLHLDHLEGVFKLAGKEWNQGVDLGFGGTISLDSPIPLFSAGPNISLGETDMKYEDVYLILNWRDRTLMLSKRADASDRDEQFFYHVFFRNSTTNPWQKVYLYTLDPQYHGVWPGHELEPVEINGETLYMSRFMKVHDEESKSMIFNNPYGGAQSQTSRLPIHDYGIYDINGYVGKSIETVVAPIIAPSYEGEPIYYNLQGIRIANPTNGIYIKSHNGKSSKVVVSR